jgi:hypothetical protein
MAYRTGHGSGRGTPHIEVVPVDELPAGMLGDACAHSPEHPATSREAFGPTERGTEEASFLARRAALARWDKANSLRVLDSLGLKGTPPAVLEPYLEDAREFARSEIARLAEQVGGGSCEGAAETFVQSAALQLAGSRAAFAAGELALGSKLADASRQNCIAAFEICARSAKSKPSDPFAEFNRRSALAQKEKKARK